MGAGSCAGTAPALSYVRQHLSPLAQQHPDLLQPQLKTLLAALLPLPAGAGMGSGADGSQQQQQLQRQGVADALAVRPPRLREGESCSCSPATGYASAKSLCCPIIVCVRMCVTPCAGRACGAAAAVPPAGPAAAGAGPGSAEPAFSALQAAALHGWLCGAARHHWPPRQRRRRCGSRASCGGAGEGRPPSVFDSGWAGCRGRAGASARSASRRGRERVRWGGSAPAAACMECVPMCPPARTPPAAHGGPPPPPPPLPDPLNPLPLLPLAALL